MYGSNVTLSDTLQALAQAPADAGKRRNRLIKRAMDIGLSAIAILLAAPLMVIIGVLIRLTSPGPALFKQTRIGKGGRPFVVYKFRTMYLGAATRVHQEHVKAFVAGRLDSAPDGSAGQAKNYKLSHDRRITGLGRLLRKTSLDELPQLFNVLKAEMSLVGPRPDVPYSVELYQDWHRLRLNVQPGITGLWQVQGRGELSFEDMMRLDCEYVQRQSPWLDLAILVRTIPAVVTMKGAV